MIVCIKSSESRSHFKTLAVAVTADKEVIRYFKFCLDCLYLQYFSSILHSYHIRKESALKQTSYLNLQTWLHIPSYYFSPLMCLVYLQYFKHDIVPGFVSHLTYFRHIVTLDSYFPTMSQSTGTLRLAESNIPHILFTNCVLYNISNCTQWLIIVYYHLEFNKKLVMGFQ